MKVLRKLAIPQIIIVICLGLISFIVINSSFADMRKHYVNDVIENRLQMINKEIEVGSRKAVSEASVFVRLPAVMEAYDIAFSGDIDDPYSPQSQKAREFLRRELAPMLDSHSEITGYKLQLHFHLPNGLSLARLWREKQTMIDGKWVDISDDISSFRPTVMDVNRTGKIVMGLEPGSGGFAIRGVVPVTTPEGRQIGSAEVLQEFNPILETVNDTGKFFISLYANKEHLDFSIELRDREKYPAKGDFIRVVEAKDSSVEALITAELLKKGREGFFAADHASMTVAAFPLNDYRGRQTGVMVCAMNTQAVSRLANTATLILAIMITGMVIAPLFVLLLRLRRLVINPITMVKEKIQDIAEDRADLTEQMPSQQNDEIGELGAWFNTLTAKLDTILKERLAMLDTINIESEKREVMAHWYKSILDSIPFLISVQDTEMKWIFINTALENILGKKREEIVGSLCSNWDISICNTESCAIACVKRGLNKTRFLHNGASYQVDVTILKDLQGKETGFIEVIQDISEMEQMTRQQAEAEAASRAKSEFLSNMSHEMRTPMNAIIGMTAIGKAANDIERTKYALGKIEDASTHLLGVINDILDMSKIEAGKLNLSMEDFNFEKMLQRVVNVISFRVNEKGQKFNLFMDKAIPPVLYGDDQRLAQIIVNLLGNAVKFTPGGGSVYLNARLIKEENGVCTIQIEVVDSGIGLSSEQQSRLFQSFQQAESSTTRKFGGTGLGLAISKSIVEMMGGRIWVESELDKGATFAFTVQLKHGDAQKYEIEHRETNWKGLRILAVDDNAGILGYMKSFIESFGACCDTAASGNEAMELAEQNDPYDIFFVDWRMPDIDALQLTRVLRTIDSDKNKTIVTMISSIEWGDIEEVARKAGVDGFLPKPLFPSAIEDIINKFLGVVQEHIDSAAENIQVTFSGKRILLAEDVGVNREIVLSLLEPMLINIDCAENGKEAVQMFKEAPEKYDMIFMDVQMPEMDGFEATRVIRAFNNPRAKTIPIIALTANVFREDIDKCIEVGMNDHLGKPLDFAVVIDSLRRYLN